MQAEGISGYVGRKGGRIIVELTGKVFGLLTVIELDPQREIGKPLRWRCRCECGSTHFLALGGSLKHGTTISCGCYRRGDPAINATTHGLSYDKRYKILRNARLRAQSRGLDFNLDYDDIVLPEVCPVLGTKISYGGGRQNENSPSLDRIDSTLGYTKGNVRVISWRANRIKSDATLAELEAIVGYIKANEIEAMFG